MMPDWDFNGDTTRTGYEAQIASLKAELDQAVGVISDRNAEIEQLRTALEEIAQEHDADRHDGKPEPCPALDAETMWAIARTALNL